MLLKYLRCSRIKIELYYLIIDYYLIKWITDVRDHMLFVHLMEFVYTVVKITIK